MARTETPVQNDRLVEILNNIEGSEHAPSNRMILFSLVAHEYNKGVDGDYKAISANIVKARLEKLNAPIKTPLGRKPSVVETLPDGTVIKKPRKARTPKEVDNNPDGLNVVKIPQGQTPLPLTSTDKDAVLDWADRMREVGKKNGEYITKDALMFHIRKNLMKDDSDKSREACQILRENLVDEFS